MACTECADKLEQLEQRADELTNGVAEVRAEVLACGRLTRSTGWLAVAVAFAVLYLVWDLDKQPGKKAAAP